MKQHKSVTACKSCNTIIGDKSTRKDRQFCSNRCKQADYRRRVKVANNPVRALVRGDNSNLIKEVSRLYASAPSITIADVTFGKGVFWRKAPHLNITGSDLITVPERPYDFRKLPYGDESFDIVVLDPPYIHSPGNHVTDDRYQNAQTTKGILYDGILDLYCEGLTEARRVAKRQIWVKCKDQVQAGRQQWLHVDILRKAEALGLIGRDLFILDATSQPSNRRWTVQHHARKSMSYLWVLEKPS